MPGQHRQIPTYSKDDALAEMREAGVDAALIHPPSTLPQTVPTAIEAARQHPDKFAILGHFAVERPENRALIDTWKQQPGMLGLRFTFNQPHQQSWWTDGTVDWLWPAAERAGVPIGLLAGGHFDVVAKDRRTASRPAAADRPHGPQRRDARMMRRSPTWANCSRWRKLPNVAVKLSGAPSYSSGAYPWRNIHGHIATDLRRVRPAPLVLGHRHHAHAVFVPAVRDDVHRGTAVPVRHRQGTGDGPRAVRLDRLETACLEPS